MINKTNYSKQTKLTRFPNFLPIFIRTIIGLPNSDQNASSAHQNGNKNVLRRVLNKRPLFSLLLYVITLSSGLVFAISNIWHCIEDEINVNIKNNLLKDCLVVILCLIWVSMGLLSINVLYNIFCSADMKDAIRNETKFYFNIPAWFILLCLVSVFIYCVVDNLVFCKQTDTNNKLISYICVLKYYSTIFYLLIACFWNYLVAITIMMISRTHTTLIRKLLTNIELDNLNIVRVSDIILERINKLNLSGISEDDSDGVESKSVSDLDEIDSESFIVNKANNLRRRLSYPNLVIKNKKNQINFVDNDLLLNLGIGSFYIEEHLRLNRKHLEQCLLMSPENCQACLFRFKSNFNNVNLRNNIICQHIMSTNEILLYFTKILYILRLTSALIQRWTASFVTCTFIWCTNCLLDWLDEKNPTFSNIFKFILPLIILAVVCGIFAETNAEGRKLLISITPLEERMAMLSYIQFNPLQMNIYGFVIDYSIELKFIGAFGIGFLSQIIIHELF